MDKKHPKKHSSKNTEANIDGDIAESIFVAGDGNVVNVGNGKVWIVVVAIGFIGMIIAVLFASHLLRDMFGAAANPGPTEPAALDEPVVSTEVFTSTPLIVTEAQSATLPIFTPTAMQGNTIEPITPEAKIDRMTVVLRSTDDDGKAPMNVKFDARDSFVTFTNGETSACGLNRYCSYNFEVYCGGNCVARTSNNDGLFSYNFGAKGIYFVSVYVCRGQTCSDDGVTITVR